MAQTVPLPASSSNLSNDLTSFLASLNPELISQLTDGSLDLTSYQSVLESELSALEAQHIEIHRTAIRSDVETLHTELEVCESILESLQEMLLGFSADLDGLSSDIAHVQNQSLTMAMQLEHRKKAEHALMLFLEKVVIPPNMANAIIYDDVDDATFVACVLDLEKKYEYVNATIQRDGEVEEQKSTGEEKDHDEEFVPPPPHLTVAGREVKNHLERLRLKAIQRTREFFLRKIAELRRPKTNVRMIQVNSLLKFSPLVDFLRDAAPDIYQEIKDVYIESMGKMVHALFRVYLAQLNRLDAKIASRHDSQLIAIDEQALKANTSLNDSWAAAFSHFSPQPKVSSNSVASTDSFNLGTRACVLDDCDRCLKPILVHLALSENKTYPYEQLFRSVLMHLVDSLTNEFVFSLEFFKDHGREVFRKIFSRTLSLILETTENYLFNCYDSIGLLLMIKINHLHHKIMKQRRVVDESIDLFFDRITGLLWPRFKFLVDSQIKCLQLSTGKKLGLSLAAESSENTAAVELHSHYVARRYAEFTSSILLAMHHNKRVWNEAARSIRKNAANDRSPKMLTPGSSTKQQIGSMALTSQSFDHNDSPTPQGLRRAVSGGDLIMIDLCTIQQETISLLKRISDDYSDKKRRNIFLINNLDQILSLFEERRVFSYKDICSPFEDMITRQREIFVEEELQQVYPKLISFVHETENKMQGETSLSTLDLNVALLESLVKDFSLNWKKGIEQINKNVLSYFSNFRNGLEILKQALTQLLLYYTRFQDIIRKSFRGKTPDFCQHLVSTTQILTEIKKYALSI